MAPNERMENGVAWRNHVFDASVIYSLDRIDGITIFTEFAKISNIRLVTTELVKNEIEKHDNENNRKKIQTLIKELGSNFFVNVTAADVNAFFNEVDSLSILKQTPFSWGIYDFWNVTFDSSYFTEFEGVYYPTKMIDRRSKDAISPADITLMAYLIKLYNKHKEKQSIYTDDAKVETIGKKSKRYATIRYIDLLNLLLKVNLSFSMFIKAINDFVENSTFSLPLGSSSPEFTTRTLEGIENHIVNFTNILIQEIRDIDELERRNKAKVVNSLKNKRDEFKREFQLELNRYSNEGYREKQEILGYQNLRNIISMYENNIKGILLPFSNLVGDLNLGWVIK